MANRKCSELNAAGNPCGMAPLKRSGKCFTHDPQFREEQTAARKKAGESTKLSKATTEAEAEFGRRMAVLFAEFFG